MRFVVAVLVAMLCLGASGSGFARNQSSQTGRQQTEVRTDSLLPLPQGTIISRQTRDRIYCFLPRNTEIQGILCRGDRHRGWETEFYRNGKLAKAWLAREQVIQGVPCMKASFWTEVFRRDAAVYFHPNGKLAKCKLARDVTLQGHKFKKGQHVRFDPEGKLILK